MAQTSHNLIGQSPAWLATQDTISGLAAIERPILVVGERGTGKSVVSTRLHFLSPRWEQSWQTVNCAALDETALDAAIFGGASFSKTGFGSESLLEKAESGTLFIDEIEYLPLRLQAKILYLLENGAYFQAGNDDPVKSDVRILAASHTDLRIAAKLGLFSADLMDVLAFDVITLPPLRARQTDIMPLAEHFAAAMVSTLGEENFPGFSVEVGEFLQKHDWPGNIRELKNVVERTVGRAWNEDGGLTLPISRVNIDPFETPWPLPAHAHMPHLEPALEQTGTYPLNTRPVNDNPAHKPGGQGGQETQENIQGVATNGTSLNQRTDAFELSIVNEALAHTDNHQGKAAEYLGLTYHQFRGLLRKHGLKK